MRSWAGRYGEVWILSSTSPRGNVVLDTIHPPGVCWYDLSIEGMAETRAVKRISDEGLSRVGVRFLGFRGPHPVAKETCYSMTRGAWKILTSSAGASVRIVEEV
jgi:hypothetical protein